MSKIEEIVSGKFRLRYFTGEPHELKGEHLGISYHYRWLEAQCILEFEGTSTKPPPVAFIIKTRKERLDEFDPNFKTHLMHDGHGSPAPDAAYSYLLKILWTRLHDGTPPLPFPVFDMDARSLFE